MRSQPWFKKQYRPRIAAYLACFSAAWLCSLSGALAQPSAAEPTEAEPAAEQAVPITVAPIKIPLSEDGEQYLRILTWSQIWARATEPNPGTQFSGGQESDFIGDVGIRRARLLLFGKITPKMLVMLHVGINNQTFSGDRKPGLFVHDAWGQYDVLENYLSIGAGIHYWNGVSRLSNASTFRFLAVDAPIVNWPVIETTDQFGRQIGVFAKGQLGRLDYRLAVNKPFTITPDLAAGGPVNFRSGDRAVAYAGYVQWMFADIESNLLPFTAGTYLGQKRVFNLGLGAHYQANATARRLVNGDIESFDMLLLGADLFFDEPLGDHGGVLTAYGAYYYYDFGPDYVRNVGIMSLGTGGTSFNGAGNRYPVLGTGHHVYAQAGWLLPVMLGTTQLQPYAALQVSSMDGLADAMIAPEAGLNWLIAGQNAKLTVHYRNRPVFVNTADKPAQNSRASELVTQLQLLL